MAAPSNSENAIQRLQRVLSNIGRDLHKPNQSSAHLLTRLEFLDYTLSHITQVMRGTVEEALQPAIEALFSDTFLKHEAMEVRVLVASCMNEIIKITAPREPFNESRMKIFFQLVNTAYESLPSVAGPVYLKTVSIMEMIAHTQSVVLMLDFELYDLVHEMFHLFLNGVRTGHPPEVISSMEKIMTLIIDNIGDVDSDEFTLGIIITNVLLFSLKKENRITSPTAFELANKVLEKCADQLKAHLPSAVTSSGIPFTGYADIVSLLCQEEIHIDNMKVTETRMDRLSLEQAADGSNGAEVRAGDFGKTPVSRDETEDVDRKRQALLEESRPVDALNVHKRIPRTNSSKRPEEGYEYLHSSSRSLGSEASSKRTSSTAKQKASTSRSRNLSPKGRKVRSGAGEEIHERPTTQEVPAKNNDSTSISAQDPEDDILIKTLISKSRRRSLKEGARPMKFSKPHLKDSSSSKVSNAETKTSIGSSQFKTQAELWRLMLD